MCQTCVTRHPSRILGVNSSTTPVSQGETGCVNVTRKCVISPLVRVLWHEQKCCVSSVVERILGKDEVASSILAHSTISPLSQTRVSLMCHAHLEDLSYPQGVMAQDDCNASPLTVNCGQASQPPLLAKRPSAPVTMQRYGACRAA